MSDKKVPQESVMPLSVTKRMLSMAEGGPLSCAFGLTRDKKECLLLIDKSGSGKLAEKLKADGKGLALDPGTVRFGTVHFQLPEDPGTVRFTVNRSEAGGTIAVLTRLAKKAGYQGIVINVDETLENAPEQEAGGAPPAPGAAPKQPKDARALSAELAALARRIPEAAGADPALRARLMKLATDTNVNIKTNNLNYAARFLAQLRDALRDALDAAGVGIGQVTPPVASRGEPTPSADAAQATPGPTTKALDADALRTELTALAGRIAAGDPARKAELLQLAAKGNAALKATNLSACAAAVAQLRDALDAGPSAPSAMDGWRAARTAAIATLTALEQAIRAFKDPRSDEAVILVRAIRANLTAEPTTPQQVGELERYLNTDDILTEAEAPNGFGIKVELRAPLLAALAGLRTGQQQPAGATR